MGELKKFMDKDFLLENEIAKKLYHDIAKDMPIIDYHCHIPPQEIYENRRFENITQIWLGGDHYKWRIMRSNGVEEKYITGDGSDRDKFQKFAEALPLAIGNPMYHWCHLELQRYFGYEGTLNGDTAQEVWDICEDKLKNDPTCDVRGLIAKSNVTMIGTTDDPIDDLKWHGKLAEEKYSVAVLPSFRPDKAVNIHKDGFVDYIKALGKVVGKELETINDVTSALESRIEYFKSFGCSAADHGLDYVMYREGTEEEINNVFQRAMKGEKITKEEAEMYQTHINCFCGKTYAKHNIVWQIHFSCARNVNTAMFNSLGADTGFDTIATTLSGEGLAKNLDALNKNNQLPRTVIYSLNPNDDQMIGTIIGAFQDSQVAGKIQHGSAWWFNDNKVGMEEQMIRLANLGILGNFIGMLTDSRSFLSYTRHEYFRRILCNLVGTWVENGEYPNDEKALKAIVAGICHDNAKRYFSL